ncbi:MAG: helix-turn-helix transcriptional regulator [Prevotella sp.]|nr:helix-turn-helix transcriptional regulator [Prevotella sp.]
MDIHEGYPKMAVIDPNTLAVMGLKSMLLSVMPTLTIDTFGSWAEWQANNPDTYVHCFVDMSIVVQHRAYFAERRKHTIVLTTSQDVEKQLADFHCLCISVPEKQLVRDALMMLQAGHHGNDQLPHAKNTSDKAKKPSENKLLSPREVEVLALIAQGLINKEIAARLNIGLTTVITHRKNIMEKLGMRSVSALTIYAVMQGYVDINKI